MLAVLIERAGGGGHEFRRVSGYLIFEFFLFSGRRIRTRRERAGRYVEYAFGTAGRTFRAG